MERPINILEMLTSYRSTPYPTMNIEPYKAMKDREIKMKLAENRLDKKKQKKNPRK